MPHLHRFYVPPSTPSGAEIALPDEEAHHAVRVLRVREGDDVAMFDGKGRDWRGRIASCDRNRVTVAVQSERIVEPPLKQVVLLQAWPGQDKAVEELIRRGTELGIADFVFFRAQRSERPPKFRSKWNRLAIESCKQCGRLWLPEFMIVPDLAAALESRYASTIVFSQQVDNRTVNLRDAVSGSSIALLIGPEGDFTDDERSLAIQHGAQPVSLGATTFRSELAALVAATLVLYELGELARC